MWAVGSEHEALRWSERDEREREGPHRLDASAQADARRRAHQANAVAVGQLERVLDGHRAADGSGLHWTSADRQLGSTQCTERRAHDADGATALIEPVAVDLSLTKVAVPDSLRRGRLAVSGSEHSGITTGRGDDERTMGSKVQ